MYGMKEWAVEKYGMIKKMCAVYKDAKHSFLFFFFS